MTSNISVAIVSDTHSYVNPHVLAIVRKCDIVVHAGDIGCADVLNQLQSRSGKIVAVCGNNDTPLTWAQNESHVVAAIQHLEHLDLPGGQLVEEHGERHGFHSPCHDKMRKAHPYARLVIYGHTHKLTIDRDASP